MRAISSRMIEGAIILSEVIAIGLIGPGEGFFSELAPELPGVKGRTVRACDASNDVPIDR